jgi:hypothetical protein
LQQNRINFSFLDLPTKKQFAPYRGSEDDFQISAARFLDTLGLLWFHPANERKTKSYELKSGQKISLEGIHLKRKGVKRGVPDCMIQEPYGGYIGFAIELKVGRNTLTEEQKWWLSELEKRGWKTLVTWSFDEFIYEVQNFVAQKRNTVLPLLQK